MSDSQCRYSHIWAIVNLNSDWLGIKNTVAHANTSSSEQSHVSCVYLERLKYTIGVCLFVMVCDRSFHAVQLQTNYWQCLFEPAELSSSLALLSTRLRILVLHNILNSDILSEISDYARATFATVCHNLDADHFQKFKIQWSILYV